jgi:hypothetical protein
MLPNPMSAPSVQIAADDLEAIDELREAWRYLRSSQRLIQQARSVPTDSGVVAGLLILAGEHLQKSEAALIRAGKLWRSCM